MTNDQLMITDESLDGEAEESMQQLKQWKVTIRLTSATNESIKSASLKFFLHPPFFN